MSTTDPIAAALAGPVATPQTTIDKILELSRAQHSTCMYSREELETFSLEKLDVIREGIKALGRRESTFRRPTFKELLGVGRRKGTKRGRKKKTLKVG